MYQSVNLKIIHVLIKQFTIVNAPNCEFINTSSIKINFMLVYRIKLGIRQARSSIDRTPRVRLSFPAHLVSGE